MSPEELTELDQPDVRAALRRHRDDDPTRLALWGSKDTSLPWRLIASQVRLRRKARARMGDWAETLLITEQALEQASSRATARHRARRLAGRLLDCTAGLGIDALSAVEAGCTVTAVEHNPGRAALLRRNAQALGLTLQVVEGDALQHLNDSWDWICCDPDRRAGGQRSMDPATWSPNVDLLLADKRPLLLKLPPALDWAGPGEQEFVSVDGEARELVVTPLGSGLSATGLTRDGSIRFRVAEGLRNPPPLLAGPDAFWFEADAAVIRAGLVAEALADHGLGCCHPEVAYGSGSHPAPGFPGKRWRVLDHGPWQTKTIRRRLGELGVERLEISRRHFPKAPDVLRKQLGLPAGGQLHLHATRLVDGQLYWVLGERLADEEPGDRVGP